MRRLALLFCVACLPAQAQQEQSESQELLGQMGGRAALIQLHATAQADGGARVTGEYLLLPTLQRRFLEGERSKQLGITFLREGSSPILYGRPPDATLQGTWSGAVFKGARYGPQGQQRERFEFSDSFPSLDGYSASVRCEAHEGRYSASLAYEVEAGRMKTLEWRSRVSPSEHPCALSGLEQQDAAQRGALRLGSGKCSVLLRDLGEFIRVTADNCAQFCGSQAYLEPMLVDRRGGCQLLRTQPR